MTDNVTAFPKTEPTEILVGPFEEYRVVVDGRMIPRLTGFKEGDKTWLILDRRISSFFPHEYAYNAAVLIANALAMGEGYPYMGSTNKERPFAPQSMEIKAPE